MTDTKKEQRDISRRQLIKRAGLLAGTGVAAGLTGFPYINRLAVRAQDAPLKFWQFYAPGGQVSSQVEWFTQMIADWNDSHDQKVELEYVPNANTSTVQSSRHPSRQVKDLMSSSSRPVISSAITMAAYCRISRPISMMRQEQTSRKALSPTAW